MNQYWQDADDTLWVKFIGAPWKRISATDRQSIVEIISPGIGTSWKFAATPPTATEMGTPSPTGTPGSGVPPRPDPEDYWTGEVWPPMERE